MKHLIAFLSIASFVGCISACEKPNTSMVEPPSNQYMSFATSLHDTLTSKAINTLELRANLEGYMIRYLTGQERRYFTYQADPERVLQAFREMAFELTDRRTDVDLRMVSFEDMKTADDYAPDESEEFWNIQPAEYYAFECLKSGIKHQVLIHKISHRVLHRVVYA
jgi:hypothetical protein